MEELLRTLHSKVERTHTLVDMVISDSYALEEAFSKGIPDDNMGVKAEIAAFLISIRSKLNEIKAEYVNN